MRTTAVIYARVSSKEQEREGFSIPSQLKLLRQYAKDHSLSVIEEFVDVETARKVGRTGFNQMLSFLSKSKACRIVLVEKTDRLYRNIKDWTTVDEHDLELHFVKENSIVSSESRSSEKFLHGIKVLMAKNYTDNLSEEVKKGLLEKAEQGKWPHRAPVGYLNDTVAHEIAPDPAKAPFIKKLFEWYASGEYSLDRLSLKSRQSGLFSRNSTAINKAGIHRILNNPIYYGEFIWKNRRYSGTHTPIISKALFDTVSEKLNRPAHINSTKREFAFGGLVKCGKCGCAMTPEIKKGKYIYYKCTGYRGKCDNEYLREEKLSAILSDVVRRVRIEPQLVEEIRAALREIQSDKVTYHQKSVESLHRRHERIERQLDRAYEDKLSGEITVDFWNRKSNEWNDELVEIRSQISAHCNANVNYFETGSQILELAKEAHSLYLGQPVMEQRRLLNSLLSNCTYYRGTLCPTYKKPFDILAKGAEFQSMRG